MAEKDRSLCTVALRSGHAMLNRAVNPSGLANAKHCVPGNFKRLDNMISTGTKRKLNPRSIGTAKRHYATAKANAKKNRPVCGKELKAGLNLMNVVLGTKIRLQTQRQCPGNQPRKNLHQTKSGKSGKINQSWHPQKG